MSKSHTKVERLLAEVVTVKTKGAASAARPGQLQLACDIMDRLDAARNGGTAAETQLAGEAPTGVGKSFALLAAAFIDANDHGRRTVISTQQKVLQNQIVTIDAPDMQQAAANLGMREIGVEVLKGWQSYLCLQRANESADALSGGVPWDEYIDQDRSGESTEVQIDGATYSREAGLHAVEWALSEDHDENSQTYGEVAGYRPPSDPTNSGARHADPLQLITITTEDCLSADCPFWDNGCAPQKSRERAKAADVVVTNHALLGIQAALGARTVFGNTHLGDFDNLMVDEAHDLSDEVRTRGTQTFSGASVQRAAIKILNFADEAERINSTHDDDLSGQAAAFDTIRELRAIAGYLLDTDEDLDALLQGFLMPSVSKEDEQRPVILEVRDYSKDDNLHNLGIRILGKLRWAVVALERTFETGDAVVQRSKESEFPRWAAINACTGLADMLARFTAEGRRVDAVWVQFRAGAASDLVEGHVAPLDVAKRVRHHLWRTADAPRASIAVSATMPENFVRACGMDSAVTCVQYESPYLPAYSNTAIYVPQLLPDEVERLTVPPADPKGRPSFNHGEHPYWAAPYVGGLVRANRGAALVLSATRSAGEHYAGYLRRLFPGVQVLDQWSTEKEEAIQRWKEDESAVLVGTKSLMTGVDAYGPTNSLVILDKITRSPEDPLLKALVNYLAPTLGWEAAIREVYVVPGATLLKQAGGRLIRRETDGGMFAVLEPRFLRANKAIPGHFGKEVKKVHRRAVEAFGEKIFELDKALDFLEEQSRHRPRLDSFKTRRAA